MVSKHVANVLCATLLIVFPIANFVHAEDAADQKSSGGELGEVVVTAEKQVSSLQKTPAAITAISADSLVEAGVTDLREAQMVVPAVRFQKEGNSTQVFVRGVGANLDLAPIEQLVAFSLNGIYVPREGTSSAFFDLAGMEVLPGPQGTLYGRSAVGGTVNVTFNRPTHDFSGRSLLEVGNYSLVHGAVAQNLPVTDKLALRLAADYAYHKGFNESGADSQNDWAGRLSGLYEPADALSVYVWSSYARKNGHPPNLVNKGTDPATGRFSPNAFLNSDPWNDLRLGSLAALAPFGQPLAEDQTYKNSSSGAQVDWNLGSMTLTYIPSYIYLDSASNYWLGAIPAFISQHYNQSSNELRLAGDSGGWKWLAGLYTYHQRNRGRFVVANIFVNSDVRDNLIEGTGVFGQATYSFTDRLRGTVGARYSYDRREADGFQTADPTTGAPLFPFAFNKNYNNVDWKAGVEFDLTRAVMLYAAAQTGYEPGTYNSAPSTPTFDNAVKPVHLTAFSAGFKSRFLDDTLQINPEFFFYNYRDLIIQQYNQNVNFNPVFNAQKIRIFGTQVDVLWKPTKDDRLNLNIGYTNARNKEFTTPAGDNYNGLQPPYSPDSTVIAGWSHLFELGPGSLDLHLDGRFESSWWADYVHNPGTQQRASAKGDASLTYQSAQKWSVGLWVKNFTNKAVLAATAAGGLPGPATCYLEAPRTYGLRFNISY